MKAMENIMKKVLLPGSYDPITRGHIDVVRRALLHFDEVHVVVFINPHKKTLFSAEERLALLKIAFADEKRVKVGADSGLVADYAARNGISLLLKGVRDAVDFDYELPMADHHKTKCDLDTFLLPCDPSFRETSSHAVRDLIEEGRPLAALLTPEVEKEVRRILAARS